MNAKALLTLIPAATVKYLCGPLRHLRALCVYAFKDSALCEPVLTAALAMGAETEMACAMDCWSGQRVPYAQEGVWAGQRPKRSDYL